MKKIGRPVIEPGGLPQFPNTEIEITNGAVGGTITTYLETCFTEHIDEDVDVVVIEMAINDERLEILARSYENLIRAVLELPNKPAILHLQVSLSINSRMHLID